MKYYNKKIGAYLAKERKAKKITQQQIADRLHVSKSAVSCWELDKRTIYAEQMINYCEALGIDPQDLIEEVVKDAGLS